MGQADAPWQVFIVYGVVYALGNAGTSNSPVTVMVSRWFPNRRGIASSGVVAGNATSNSVLSNAHKGTQQSGRLWVVRYSRQNPALRKASRVSLPSKSLRIRRY